MHPAASNRGHIDDRPFGRGQLIHQTPRQDDRGKEIHVKHLPPRAQVSRQRRQTRAAGAFGADACVIDQRVQLAIDLGLDNLKGCNGFIWAGKVDLDVILFPARPRAAWIKGLARTGQHPPAFGRKALDCGVPDATRGAC